MERDDALEQLYNSISNLGPHALRQIALEYLGELSSRSDSDILRFGIKFDFWDRGTRIESSFELTEADTVYKYTKPEVVQFCRDMENAGFEIEHYHGRFYWQGPAVRAEALEEVASATNVKLQHDSMGLGVIVYPRHGDNGGVK